MLGDKAVDASLANRGAAVWVNKSCFTCHAIGKKLAGPDLIGITERRDHDWLRAWLRNTDSMLVSGDAQVKAMKDENFGARMPNFKLQPNDIEALLHYMAQETARARAAGK
jgi:mono/diheme cytochrome c family protein